MPLIEYEPNTMRFEALAAEEEDRSRLSLAADNWHEIAVYIDETYGR